MFQFLIGRLKTCNQMNAYVPENPFQFLIGRLKTMVMKAQKKIYRSFNSL